MSAVSGLRVIPLLDSHLTASASSLGLTSPVSSSCKAMEPLNASSNRTAKPFMSDVDSPLSCFCFFGLYINPNLIGNSVKIC